VNVEDPKKSHIIVFCHEDKRHTFHDDSFIRFRELQGIVELNDSEALKISVIDGYSFKVWVDPNSLSDYTGGGIVEDVKIAVPYKHGSLEEAITFPLKHAKDGQFYVFDFAAFERPG
jgi:hypothetical protein